MRRTTHLPVCFWSEASKAVKQWVWNIPWHSFRHCHLVKKKWLQCNKLATLAPHASEFGAQCPCLSWNLYIYIYFYVHRVIGERMDGRWKLWKKRSDSQTERFLRFLSPCCMYTFSFSLLRVANPWLTTCTLAVFAVFAMCVMHQSRCHVNWCMTIPGYTIATRICSEPIQRC